MPLFLENYGLEAFGEDEQALTNLVMTVAQNGVPIVGYYGIPYLNLHLGDVQMIDRVEKREDGWEIVDIDSHIAGPCVWTLRVIDEMNGKDRLSKKLMVRSEDENGLVVLHVVNADVLPSYAQNEKIRLQMAAFPKEIHYYADEQGYIDSVEPGLNGRKLMVALNRVIPVGMLFQSGDPDVKDLCQIHATVKKLYKGTVKLNDEEFHPYISCRVDTQYGELEIIHTKEAVDDAEFENLKVGSVINCLAILSGDAAIFAYDKGVVHDKENNLKLVAYSMGKGDPERLRTALAEDAVYLSDHSQNSWNTPGEIIDRFQRVHERTAECHPLYAKITQIEAGEEEASYPVDTECLVLTYEDREGYQAIVFVDTNEQGYISKIHVTENHRYKFAVKKPPKVGKEDFRLPDSAEQGMLWRAHFLALFPKAVKIDLV